MKRSQTRLVSKLALILTILFSLNAGGFAIGKIDPTFGTAGSVAINPGANTKVVDMAVQADGKILIAGYFDAGVFVMRLNADGSVDSGYGVSGVALVTLPFSHFIADIELQSDGKLVGVGVASSDFLVFRLKTDGSLDETFNGAGFRTIDQGVTDFFNKVAIQPDGKIVAVGQSFNNMFDFSRLAVTMRFTAGGEFDRTFNRTGIAAYSYSYAWDPGMGYFPLADVEILGDGRIMTLGHYDTGGDDGYFIQMLNPNGSIDSSFGVPKIYAPDYRTWDTDGAHTPDAEILADGSVAIASQVGIRITDFSTFDKTLPQYGGAITALPDGGFVTVSGFGARVFSRGKYLSNAWNFGAERTARQPDGKLLFLKNNGNAGGLVTRGTITGSQGNRQANFSRDHRSDMAIFRHSEKNLYVAQLAGGSFIRKTGQNFIKYFPEYAQFETTSPQRIWREATIGWGNNTSSTPGSPVYFIFEIGSNTNCFGCGYLVQWGVVGDIPYGGDFTGDGFLDVGVFRPETGVWWGFNSAQFSQQSPTVQWGENGDKPVPADYDFDGLTDYAVYRPSNGTWWVRRSSDGSFFVVNFGLSTDIPLTGDYDGDGFADFTVYRPSEGAWYQYTTTEGFKYYQFGLPTDTPVPNDYDGDGRFDIAVYRDGVWHLLQSRDGYRTINWGSSGDMLVTTRYDQ